MQIRSLSSFKNSLQQQCQFQLQFAALPPPPQLIFAVMASPEVLKKAGRNYLDTPEQMNLVELMCEFVEAMNPGLIFSKKPQILKDRDLTGELKDIWSAVQNFRDKEKAGVSDIVVYTEFGPESAASPPLRPSIDIFAPSPMDHSQQHQTQQQSQQNCENNGHIDELESTENSISIDNNERLHSRNDDINANADNDDETTNGKSNKSSENEEETNAVVVIEKLSLGDNCAGSKKSKNSNSNNFNNENESSEKLVKVQNQKNKESHQHHFFPKFLTSSKDKDKDKDKDTKEKEKEKDESSQETKVKTKKSLNFFRRNKTSTTGSPTHAATTTTSSNQQQKTDAE